MTEEPTDPTLVHDVPPDVDDEDDEPISVLTKVVIAVIIAVVFFFLVKACGGDDDKPTDAVSAEGASSDDAGSDTDGNDAAGVDAEALQQKCFDAGYWYDSEGVCYREDPTGKTGAELAAIRVELPADGDESAAGGAPGADGPADPSAAGPVAPGSKAGLVPPGGATTPPPGGSGTPAPAPNATTTAPQNATTTAPQNPTTTVRQPVTVERRSGNTGESQWTLKTTFPDPSDPSSTNGNTHTMQFKIVNGAVSGQGYDQTTEANFVMTGSVAPDGTFSDFKATAVNEASKGSFEFHPATLDVNKSAPFPCDEPGTKHADRCITITGTYKQIFNGTTNTTGTFVMTRQI